MVSLISKRPGADSLLMNTGLALALAGQGGGPVRPRFGPTEASLFSRGLDAPRQAQVHAAQMADAEHKAKMRPLQAQQLQGAIAAQAPAAKLADTTLKIKQGELDAINRRKALSDAIFKRLNLDLTPDDLQGGDAGDRLTNPAGDTLSGSGVMDVDAATDLVGSDQPIKTKNFLDSLDEKTLLGIAASPDPLKAISTLMLRKGADAMSPNQYRIPSGDKVQAWFDPQARRFRYRNQQGESVDLPYGAERVTPTSSGRERMKPNDMHKLRGEVFDTEKAVRDITKYMDNVKEGSHGLKLLADRWTSKLKSVFGKDLSPAQINSMVQTGRINSLLGQFRKEVVGGGVMTEQDALRVLSALGGEPNATRHPEIVRQLLHQIVSEKVNRYNSVSLPTFNTQLELRGQKKREPLTVPKAFTEPFSFSGSVSEMSDDDILKALQ